MLACRLSAPVSETCLQYVLTHLLLLNCPLLAGLAVLAILLRVEAILQQQASPATQMMTWPS
jgi:hypothetical protein